MKKLKVLMVGAGSIGQKELKELKSHPLVKIVGLVEIDEERKKAMSHLVPKTYTDLAEAIQDSTPDLVRIATSPQTHYELAVIALRAKKDVYIEKIMTIRSKDAKEIVKLAKEMGKFVYVRRNAIYTPVYKQAWDMLHEIGEVKHVHWIEPIEKYSYWSKPKQEWLHNLPGGIISEHLPHALYTVRWFLGGQPEVIDAKYTGKELHVALKFGDKRAEISYIEPSDTPMILDITGSKGFMHINHSTYRIIKPKGYEHSSSPEWRTVKANLHDLGGCLTNMLRLGWHLFIRTFHLNSKSMFSKSDNYRQFTDIANGGNTGGDFEIDGEEGVKNVELFEKIWMKAGVLEEK